MPVHFTNVPKDANMNPPLVDTYRQHKESLYAKTARNPKFKRAMQQANNRTQTSGSQRQIFVEDNATKWYAAQRSPFVVSPPTMPPPLLAAQPTIPQQMQLFDTVSVTSYSMRPQPSYPWMFDNRKPQVYKMPTSCDSKCLANPASGQMTQWPACYTDNTISQSTAHMSKRPRVVLKKQMLTRTNEHNTQLLIENDAGKMKETKSSGSIVGDNFYKKDNPFRQASEPHKKMDERSSKIEITATKPAASKSSVQFIEQWEFSIPSSELSLNKKQNHGCSYSNFFQNAKHEEGYEADSECGTSYEAHLASALRKKRYTKNKRLATKPVKQLFGENSYSVSSSSSDSSYKRCCGNKEFKVIYVVTDRNDSSDDIAETSISKQKLESCTGQVQTNKSSHEKISSKCCNKNNKCIAPDKPETMTSQQTFDIDRSFESKKEPKAKPSSVQNPSMEHEIYTPPHSTVLNSEALESERQSLQLKFHASESSNLSAIHDKISLSGTQYTLPTREHRTSEIRFGQRSQVQRTPTSCPINDEELNLDMCTITNNIQTNALSCNHSKRNAGGRDMQVKEVALSDNYINYEQHASKKIGEEVSFFGQTSVDLTLNETASVESLQEPTEERNQQENLTPQVVLAEHEGETISRGKKQSSIASKSHEKEKINGGVEDEHRFSKKYRDCRELEDIVTAAQKLDNQIDVGTTYATFEMYREETTNARINQKPRTSETSQSRLNFEANEHCSMEKDRTSRKKAETCPEKDQKLHNPHSNTQLERNNFEAAETESQRNMSNECHVVMSQTQYDKHSSQACEDNILKYDQTRKNESYFAEKEGSKVDHFTERVRQREKTSNYVEDRTGFSSLASDYSECAQVKCHRKICTTSHITPKCTEDDACQEVAKFSSAENAAMKCESKNRSYSEEWNEQYIPKQCHKNEIKSDRVQQSRLTVYQVKDNANDQESSCVSKNSEVLPRKSHRRKQQEHNKNFSSQENPTIEENKISVKLKSQKKLCNVGGEDKSDKCSKESDKCEYYRKKHQIWKEQQNLNHHHENFEVRPSCKYELSQKADKNELEPKKSHRSNYQMWKEGNDTKHCIEKIKMKRTHRHERLSTPAADNTELEALLAFNRERLESIDNLFKQIEARCVNRSTQVEWSLSSRNSQRKNFLGRNNKCASVSHKLPNETSSDHSSLKEFFLNQNSIQNTNKTASIEKETSFTSIHNMDLMSQDTEVHSIPGTLGLSSKDSTITPNTNNSTLSVEALPTVMPFRLERTYNRAVSADSFDESFATEKSEIAPANGVGITLCSPTLQVNQSSHNFSTFENLFEGSSQAKSLIQMHDPQSGATAWKEQFEETNIDDYHRTSSNISLLKRKHHNIEVRQKQIKDDVPQPQTLQKDPTLSNFLTQCLLMSQQNEKLNLTKSQASIESCSKNSMDDVVRTVESLNLHSTPKNSHKTEQMRSTAARVLDYNGEALPRNEVKKEESDLSKFYARLKEINLSKDSKDGQSSYDTEKEIENTSTPVADTDSILLPAENVQKSIKTDCEPKPIVVSNENSQEIAQFLNEKPVNQAEFEADVPKEGLAEQIVAENVETYKENEQLECTVPQETPCDTLTLAPPFPICSIKGHTKKCGHIMKSKGNSKIAEQNGETVCIPAIICAPVARLSKMSKFFKAQVKIMAGPSMLATAKAINEGALSDKSMKALQQYMKKSQSKQKKKLKTKTNHLKASREVQTEETVPKQKRTVRFKSPCVDVHVTDDECKSKHNKDKLKKKEKLKGILKKHNNTEARYPESIREYYEMFQHELTEPVSNITNPNDLVDNLTDPNNTTSRECSGYDDDLASLNEDVFNFCKAREATHPTLLHSEEGEEGVIDPGHHAGDYGNELNKGGFKDVDKTVLNKKGSRSKLSKLDLNDQYAVIRTIIDSLKEIKPYPRKGRAIQTSKTNAETQYLTQNSPMNSQISQSKENACVVEKLENKKKSSGKGFPNKKTR